MYEVVKFYQDPSKKAKVLRGGCTLEEARALCDDPELSSRTAKPPKGCGGNEHKIQAWSDKQKHWFVGFRRQA